MTTKGMSSRLRALLKRNDALRVALAEIRRMERQVQEYSDLSSALGRRAHEAEDKVAELEKQLAAQIKMNEDQLSDEAHMLRHGSLIVRIEQLEQEIERLKSYKELRVLRVTREGEQHIEVVSCTNCDAHREACKKMARDWAEDEWLRLDERSDEVEEEWVEEQTRNILREYGLEVSDERG